MTRGSRGAQAVTFRSPVDRIPSDRRGDLGSRLFNARCFLSEKRKKKVCIHDMAEVFGVPLRTYHDWELGNKKPSSAALAHIESKMKEIYQ